MEKQNKNIPKIAYWLLSKTISKDIRYAVLGDFEELFYEKLNSKGSWAAILWYWWQVVKSIPKLFSDKIYWGVVMFKNYIKISFRNMIRHKTYSLINITGLAIGMAVCLLIGAYVLSELNFDKFHDKSDRIYRVTTNIDLGSNPIHVASSNYPAAETMKERYPEVEDAVRFKQLYTRVNLQFENEKIIENGFVYSDNSIFDIFSFNLIKGDPETALADPYSIVLTENIADKLFHGRNPVGEMIILNNDTEFKVTGVVENPPFNSHIRFSMLGSFITLRDVIGDQYYKWTGDFQNFTYVLLNNKQNAKTLQAKLPELINEKIGDILTKVSGNIELIIEPFSDIYLHSQYVNQFGPSGDYDYVIIFSSVVILILLIACVNFMNLSTARSMTRALEIGMRKVHGASKLQLIIQFIGESLFYSVLSLVLAIMLLPVLWPIVYEFAGIDSSILVVHLNQMFLMAIGLILVIGLIAGLYPAVYLSSQNLADSLLEKSKSKKSALFRKVLVVTQFVISITLIGSTGIINDQLEYVRTKDLGFQRENILVVPVNSQDHRNGVDSKKTELLKHSKIKSIATAASAPGEGARHNVFQPDDRTSQESIRFAAINIDHDYINTLKLKMLSGRNFSKEFATDPTNSIIINQAALNTLGWDNPIGRTIRELNGRQVDKTVIGVVNDFHFSSLNDVLEPLVIENEINRTRNYLLNISTENFQETIKYVENILHNKESGREFNYYFLDELLNSHFGFVNRLENLFSYFTLLAIFLAIIGLLGLASFAAEQRTKEIGIRKVLGASISSVAVLLSNEFIKWVLVGSCIAIPVIIYAMNSWLDNFPYRTEISIITLLVAGFIALIISLLTVSFVTIKSARRNPVDSLKYE